MCADTPFKIDLHTTRDVLASAYALIHFVEKDINLHATSDQKDHEGEAITNHRQLQRIIALVVLVYALRQHSSAHCGWSLTPSSFRPCSARSVFQKLSPTWFPAYSMRVCIECHAIANDFRTDLSDLQCARQKRYLSALVREYTLEH